MERSYSEIIRIPSYELDENRRLKISAVLKLMQEIAGRHLEQDGLSYEMMRKNGVVFLLTNVAVRIFRLPAYAEEVLGKTWFCETRRAQFVRCMRFTQGNEILFEAETLWVTADPEKHRILRPSEFQFGMPENNTDTVTVSASRIVCPETMEFTENREIRRTDIDCNGHVGNFVYADILVDAMPPEIRPCDIAELHIAYQKEAFLGEILHISRVKSENGFVFKALADGRRCFEAFVRLGG